jgi:hypothetical protein
MKKAFWVLIALVVVGLAAVQAQTKQQQQELEQIAKRSMNGLSPQDRQRVVQIMTDVYVAQGMSRQQAAQLAGMAADSMFSDYQEDAQSAEARGRVQEQQQQNRSPGNLVRSVPEDATRGWPANSLFENHATVRLAQPTITTPHGITVSYEIESYTTLVIYVTRNYMDNDERGAYWSDSDTQWFMNYIKQGTGVTLQKSGAIPLLYNTQYEGKTPWNTKGEGTAIGLQLDFNRMIIKLQKIYRTEGAGGRG